MGKAPPFAGVPGWVINSGEWARLTGSVRSVLVVLCLHADRNGDAWPGVQRLAELAGVTDRTVQKSIRQLERLKILGIGDGGGRGLTNQYTVQQKGVPADTVSPALNPVPQNTLSPETPSAPTENPVQPVRKPRPPGHPNTKNTTATPKNSAREKPPTKKKQQRARGKNEILAMDLTRLYREKIARLGDNTLGPKGRGPRNIAKLLEDHKSEELRAAIVNYAESCAILGTEHQYRIACGNFFGKAETYDMYLPANYEKPEAPQTAATGPVDPNETYALALDARRKDRRP